MHALTTNMSRFGCVAAIVVALGGCTSSFDRTPIDTHIVCVAADGACAPEKLMEAFKTWQAEKVLFRPGSCFRVTAVTDDGAQPVFTRCVPETWHTDVTKDKSEFLMEARASLAQPLLAMPSLDAGHRAPIVGAIAYDVRVFGADIAPDVAAIMQVDARTPAPTATHVACVCDSSDTGHDAPACTGVSLTMAMDVWLRAGGTHPGSSFRVFAVRGPQVAPSEVFEVTSPAQVEPGARVAHLLAKRRELAPLAEHLQQGRTFSAVAEAIEAAIDRVRTYPGRHALIVLSDMRQRADQFDFERAVPPAAEFRRVLDQKGLHLDATGMPIVICGVHDQGGRGRALDGRLGDAVEEVWRAILTPKAASVVLQQRCSLDTVTLLSSVRREGEAAS